MAGQLKYDAFISYRHCELDKFVAINLHKKLERFKLPKSVVKLVSGDKRRIERVFRDEDELPLSSNLSDPINQALSNTDFLIVICTPRLPESRWCLKEIETFLEMHDRNNILLVLAEGEPEESFPEILTYNEIEETDEQGNTIKVRKELEPLAADVRGESRKDILKAMDIAVIKLAAAMFGLNFDDLKQRHRESRIKRLAAVWGAVSLGLLVFALVCLFLLTKISLQKKELSDKYAGSMAIASSELLDVGKRNAALYAVRSVLHESGNYNSEAYRMLVNAICPYAVLDQYIPVKTISIKTGILDFKFSRDGKYLVIKGQNGDCYVYDIESEKEIYNFSTIDVDYGLPVYAFDNDNGLIYSSEDFIEYVNLDTGDTEELYDDSGYVISNDNSDYIICMAKNSIECYEGSKYIYSVNLGKYNIDIDRYYEFSYSFTDDGENIVLVANSDIEKDFMISIDLKDMEVDGLLMLNTDGSSEVAVNSKYIYLLNDDYYKDSTILYVIDTASYDIVDSFDVNMEFAKDIRIIKDSLAIYSLESIRVFNLDTFEETGHLEVPELIADVSEYDDQVMVIDSKGKAYLVGGDYEYGIDYTYNLFGIVLHSEINVCQANEKYLGFAIYDSNYVVIYGKNENSSYEEYDMFNEGDNSDESDCLYRDEFEEYKDASEEISKLGDIEEAYVYSLIYSSDDKYILVMMMDGTLRIYDADNFELMNTLYTVGNVTMSSFVYLEKEEIYVLNASPYSYILDKNFNYISKLDYCLGYDDGCFIVEKEGDYYKVPYISYTEMLKLADDILGEYVPEEEVMVRYGISK